MGEGAAATVRKAKWGRSQVALKLFRGQPEQIYKELTAEAAILHVSRALLRAPRRRVRRSNTLLHACRSSSVLGLHAILCRKPAAGCRQRQLNTVSGSARTSVSSATSHEDALKDIVPEICRPYGLVLEYCTNVT